MNIAQSFNPKLLDWYDRNKREMPWRGQNAPYRIWLSEIIMQQTQVAQGTPYYLHFIEKYPTVHTLAAAKEVDVLKSWEGLGYYSRARNLHKTAKLISGNMDGQFPGDYQGLLKLPGVGPYTAAAIASICYQEPVPVIDGNVNRFISRYRDIHVPVDSGAGRALIYDFLEQHIGHSPQVAKFNQALMEFGALKCKARQPECEGCPFNTSCLAFQAGTVALLPIKKSKLKTRRRFIDFHVLLHDADRVYVRQRQGAGIWRGLYEFVSIEHTEAPEPLADEAQAAAEYSHVLSHQRIEARFFISAAPATAPSGYESVALAELKDLPMARISTRFMESRPEVFDAKWV